MRGSSLIAGHFVAVVFGVLLLIACSAKPRPTGVSLQQLSPATSRAPQIALTRAVTPSNQTAIVRSSPTPRPSPTFRPQPSSRQLTTGGCCPQPFWSDNGQYVLLVDRPAGQPLGVYGVDVEHPGSPELIAESIVVQSGAGAFFVHPNGNTTVVQRAATDEQFVIANGGRPVSVSPDGQQLLWQVIGRTGNYDQRRSQTWVANLDGSDARVVGETLGIGASQWIDGRRILLVGLPLEEPSIVAIAVLALGQKDTDEHLSELARVTSPNGTLVSPGGNWLVYYLTFQSNPDDDGVWLVPTDGNQPPRKLGFFGGYRWRDDSRLLYVPMEPGVPSHSLWEYDVANDTNRRLIDPSQRPFKIANNDWAVSANGRYMVYVEAADHNLWLFDLAGLAP